jgi:hypothetical protein
MGIECRNRPAVVTPKTLPRRVGCLSGNEKRGRNARGRCLLACCDGIADSGAHCGGGMRAGQNRLERHWNPFS